VRPTLWQRMDLWARHLLPVCLTLLLLLLSLVPMRVPDFANVAPKLTLVSIYYWSIYRPDLLPVHAAFLLGLLLDIVSAMPIGVNALIFVLLHGFVSSRRRFFLGKGFLVTWWAFSVIGGGAIGLSWLLASALLGRWMDVQPVLFTYFLTMASYPVFGWFLIRAQVTFLREA
jgi:rod shape-determining protein MreD